jgi:tRNA(fMet)-specific endonuclease VapC
MNGWLLDTNVLIDLVFARGPTLTARYISELTAATPLFLSTVTVFEFRFGAERSRRREFQLEALERFLTSVSILDFTESNARAAALIKAELSRAGTPIGPYDLMIAAQARTHDLAVATGNIREFGRVTGLTVEDWGAAS